MARRSVAEFMGTFWLVFGGCGSAVLAAAFPGLGIGFGGVALAFGLTVLHTACRNRAQAGDVPVASVLATDLLDSRLRHGV